MRLILAVIIALISAAVPSPSMAATDLYRWGGYTPAYWPGYNDGRSFAYLSLSLKDDLGLNEARTYGLSDLASIHIDWSAGMRNKKGEGVAGAAWKADLGEIGSFSAFFQNIAGTLRIIDLALTTKTVAPWIAYGGNLGPTVFTVDKGTNFSFTDGVGTGGGYFLSVPEPSVWLTLFVGFAAAGGVLRRRAMVAPHLSLTK